MWESCIPDTVFGTEVDHFQKVYQFMPNIEQTFFCNLFNNLMNYLKRDTNISTGSLTIVILRTDFQCENAINVEMMSLAQVRMNDGAMMI